MVCSKARTSMEVNFVEYFSVAAAGNLLGQQSAWKFLGTAWKFWHSLVSRQGKEAAAD